MKNHIRLVERQKAMEESPIYYVETRTSWWPFWRVLSWSLYRPKMLKEYQEVIKRPQKDTFRILAETATVT